MNSMYNSYNNNENKQSSRDNSQLKGMKKRFEIRYYSRQLTHLLTYKFHGEYKLNSSCRDFRVIATRLFYVFFLLFPYTLVINSPLHRVRRNVVYLPTSCTIFITFFERKEKYFIKTYPYTLYIYISLLLRYNTRIIRTSQHTRTDNYPSNRDPRARARR